MRVGIYQCAAGTVPADERLNDLKSRLDAEDLDLLVCPELFLSGYTPGPALSERAEPKDGPFGQRIAQLAGETETAIAYGYPELGDDVLFNSAVLYDAQGACIANHRKQLPSPKSFEETAFSKGSTVTFAEWNNWRVAIVICYEVEFPESVRRAALGGADLVIVPTALGADWGVVAEKVVPTRAYENGVWVAYADQIGEADGLRFYGGSRIVGPDGQERAVAGPKTAVISAEIDLESVQQMQARLPFLRDCIALEPPN